MPVQVAPAAENNFTKGLITESSGLNFPENACTETYNCIFNLDGTVSRRQGFDYEVNYVEKTINRTDVAVSTFLWRNATGDGSINLFVVQVGATVYFYDTASSSTSSGALTSNISLNSFLASGAPAPDVLECQFANSSDYLIITHPYCDPIRVSYNSSTTTVSGTAITLKIRDLEGDATDPNAIDNRPTTTKAAMNTAHRYNLLNQGWDDVKGLDAWDTAQTTMPSNCDVMWRFRDSSNNLDFTTSTINKIVLGNTPAPKGHYILPLTSQNRDTASGLTGTTSRTSSYQRPSTCSFFAGRVFYSGLNYPGYNSRIWFSQVIERDEQYGFCYQVNDPTAQDLFDLLPTDGGVIYIPEAGTIIKLFPIQGTLLVFATNGVWSITGSSGIGFTANDYTVVKISTTGALTSSSFVDIAGVPAWWNSDGIYVIEQSQGAPGVKNLTLSSIATFYNDIPLASKYFARGFYNAVTGVVQWIYRSTAGATPTENYTFNSILNLNVFTGAFYPWTISSSDVTINGVVVLQGVSAQITTNNVVNDTANLVIDDSSNQVISFNFLASTEGTSPIFKYLVSRSSGGSYLFAFASESNVDYLDWVSINTGTDYESYFISGYKLPGQAQKKFQPAWLVLYSDLGEGAVKYYFQGIWDYSQSSAAGRWSTPQLISKDDLNYSNAISRLKVRGHGKALQFKVSSYTGSRMNVAGWSAMNTINQIP